LKELSVSEYAVILYNLSAGEIQSRDISAQWIRGFRAFVFAGWIG